MDVSEWHRADLGDHPEAGTEVTAVMFPADSPGSVILYSRLRVEVVMVGEHGTTMAGPQLPSDLRVEIPERPSNITGKRGILWKLYEEPE